MRVRFLFPSLIVAAVVSILVGCTPINPSGTIAPPAEVPAAAQPVAPPPPAPPSTGETSDEPTDESIGFQIRRLLNSDPTSAAGIIIEVDDGHVTLRGTAVTSEASWRAEGIAHSVKGVKSVLNQIIVNTPRITQ